MRTWRIYVAAALVGMALACTGKSSETREVVFGPTPTPGSGTLTAPTPETQINDAQLDTLRPTFTVRNGTSTGSAAKTYEFQVSDKDDFSSLVAQSSSVPEGAGTTSFTPTTDLQPATRMFWRARLVQGSSMSAFSSTAGFRTKLVGFNRPGELFDPLAGETIGTRSGSTAFLAGRGLQVIDAGSFVRYQLASTLTSGEISVDVENLRANAPGSKSRIFSMMDGANLLFNSKFLFNVQYRGVDGNPDNAISYKVLMGDEDLKFEPDLSQRTAGIRFLNPATTYVWTASWGSVFRLTIREGSSTGPVVYDRSQSTAGVYSPSPHIVMLGANDAALESGSYVGAIYRNFWVGSKPRPATLGSALSRR